MLTDSNPCWREEMPVLYRKRKPRSWAQKSRGQAKTGMMLRRRVSQRGTSAMRDLGTARNGAGTGGILVLRSTATYDWSRPTANRRRTKRAGLFDPDAFARNELSA
jgi:hypothetical protein